MTIANHEASDIDFMGLDGIFDTKHKKVSTGWLPTNTGVIQIPFSGVIAEAVQSVAISSRVSSENLLAIGNKGHAGYSKRFGGVDVTIDAVLTDNYNTSGAIGYQLADFDAQLKSGLILWTTNGTLGRKATVTGIYANSITFTFNANDTSTTSWGFAGDGVLWENYIVADSGAKGNRDYHCINPLTWDEIHIFDGSNSVILTGVQTATFTANINRQDVFQIGQFTPYDRSVTYPYDVSVTINTLANDVRLTNWWDKFVPNYDPMSDCAGGLVIKVRTQSIAGVATTKDMIIASGLRPTNGTLNTAVGSNSTVSLTFNGTSLYF